MPASLSVVLSQGPQGLPMEARPLHYPHPEAAAGALVLTTSPPAGHTPHLLTPVTPEGPSTAARDTACGHTYYRWGDKCLLPQQCKQLRSGLLSSSLRLWTQKNGGRRLQTWLLRAQWSQGQHMRCHQIWDRGSEFGGPQEKPGFPGSEDVKSSRFPNHSSDPQAQITASEEEHISYNLLPDAFRV